MEHHEAKGGIDYNFMKKEERKREKREKGARSQSLGQGQQNYERKWVSMGG